MPRLDVVTRNVADFARYPLVFNPWELAQEGSVHTSGRMRALRGYAGLRESQHRHYFDPCAEVLIHSREAAAIIGIERLFVLPTA